MQDPARAAFLDPRGQDELQLRNSAAVGYLCGIVLASYDCAHVARSNLTDGDLQRFATENLQIGVPQRKGSATILVQQTKLPNLWLGDRESDRLECRFASHHSNDWSPLSSAALFVNEL